MRTKAPKMLTKAVDLAMQAVLEALVLEYDSAACKTALAETKKTRKKDEMGRMIKTENQLLQERQQIFLKDKHFLKYCEEQKRNPEHIHFYRKASKLKRLEHNFNAYSKQMNRIFSLFIAPGAIQQIGLKDDLRKRLEIAYYLAPLMVRVRVEVVFKYKRRLRAAVNTGPLETFKKSSYVESLSPEWFNKYSDFEDKWLNGSNLYHSLTEMEWLEHDFREYMRFYGGIATTIESDYLDFNDIDGDEFVDDAEKFFRLGTELVDKHQLVICDN